MALHNVGDLLSSDFYTSLSFQVHVCIHEGGTSLPTEQSPGNHWTSVIIIPKTGDILYGDSFHDTPPKDLVELLTWWLSQHPFPVPFTWSDLECTIQLEGDSRSCGLLSYNAIAHYHMPSVVPLISANEVDVNRVLMFLKIFGHLDAMVS